MPVPVHTFDASLVTVVFGVMPLMEPAPGTFVKVSRNNDTFKSYVGSQGEVARSRSRDRTGSVEVTLMQTSPSNDYLSAMAALDEKFGAGVAPVIVRDLNGTTVCEGVAAWVRKPADTEYGNEAGPRTWTIDVAQLDMLVGGNIL